MQFYSSHFLNLLWLTPILVLCFVASGWLHAKRVRQFFQTDEIKIKLLPHYSRSEWPIRAILLSLAFILTVMALSQPQWGEEKKRIERKGIDLVFMLDVSTSMLAEDIKPSRIQKAKFEIESFVKTLKGDRIGMLTFAGSSFMQTPLTLDYSAFLIFLNGVDVGHVPDPGTLLGPAIKKAVESFPEEKGNQHRALIIFSDGEDHEADLAPAIELAKRKNIRIYTIGTATPEGGPIPLTDERGLQTGVKKDRAGKIVITKLNKELLARVSKETGGIYLPSTPGEREIDLVIRHFSSLGEKKLEDRLVSEKEDHYQIFVLLAFLCLILEMLVRRGKSIRRLPLSALLLLFLIHSGFLITPQQKVEKGNDDFKNKRYQSAVQKYRELQVRNPDSPPVEYNLATSLYKLDQYQESAAHLKNAIEKSKDTPELQAKAAYNYGNALYRVGDYDGAIASYKKALDLNPRDDDSKYNLEFILNKKNKFEKENQDRKKNNPEKKKDPKQQSQDKQKNQQNQGGGSNQDKNQGQANQKNQQGSGEQKQDKNQNQGGTGQNQKQTGGGNNSEKQEQAQGQNQQDQKQQGNQSDQKKDEQNPKAGESSEKDKKENQDQDNKNQGDQNSKESQGKESSSDQKQGGSGNSGNEQQNQPSPQSAGNQQGQNSQTPQDLNGLNRENQSKEDNQNGQSPEPVAGSEPSQQNGSDAAAGATSEQKPLQGQMTKENAQYLLSSLEEGEKKMHILRKPAKENQSTPYVEKDW